MLESTSLTWRKSRRSTQNGACVEIGVSHGGVPVAIRDSKNPEGGKLAFSRSELRSFMTRVKTL
ncbi:DUF397 domain-containing protein [Actinocorallia libanotica]|uniref:DUF397 domain-containing protein n=1 Tax=Actinocorallia libanotica TaxID=46162 RepID=A0ABN1Q9F3_9ACTN